MPPKKGKQPQGGESRNPLRYAGVTDAEYEKAYKMGEEHLKEQKSLVDGIVKSYQSLNTAAQEQGKLEAYLNGNLLERQMLEDLANKAKKEGTDITSDDVDNVKKQVGQQKKLGTAVENILPGAVGFASGIERAAMGMKGLLGPAAIVVAIFVAIAKVALDYAKNIADTRKELGVSVTTAMKLNTQNKILGMQAKAYGLDIEDIKNAQAAIRNDLGASVQEAANLSLSFARTSAATGQSAEDLSKTLSIMESISSSSREVLLNQLRSNAAMIEAAGVAPALVMKDLAANAEFFASHAKDGGQNIIDAGVAARKLGLDMSSVASAAESLLDFESSIEKSMEASMLLGREINTDRARQLMMQGKTKEMMDEIRRVAGTEAAFQEMNVLEKRALAAAFGQSVEQLSRIVRNNGSAATGGAVGAAIGKPESLYNLHAQGYEGMTGELVRIRKTME
tara:strand:- start:937 stop:2289 length:1353 start_codon:yes stop_codon:yes gene_type:complete